MELKRGDRARVQTEMVEFIALSFPFSSKLKIRSFDVVVVQGQQRNVVLLVKTIDFLTFPLPSPSWFRKALIDLIIYANTPLNVPLVPFWFILVHSIF